MLDFIERNKHGKLIGGVVAGVLGLGFYMSTNHFHLFEPRLLPMGWIDRQAPFVPWSVWVYFSDYLILVMAYVWLREPLHQARFLVGFVALCAASSLIFVVWPTSYPRFSFPLPDPPITFSEWGLYMFRYIDTPANCAPSLHVSASYFSAFVFVQEQRRKLPGMVLWATAIWMSTLTTKQHYWIDGVLGIGMAVAAYRFSLAYLPAHAPARSTVVKKRRRVMH